MHRYLPDDIVELLFAQLVTTYGAAFARQYDGANLAAVKNDWKRELGGFVRSDKDGLPIAPAVLYGLQHLPERPPNIIQFRAICRRWTATDEQPKLTGKVTIPENIKAEFARLKAPASTEPERVRVARRYIATFGGPRVHRTPRHTENLAHYRAVLDRWVAGIPEPEVATA